MNYKESLYGWLTSIWVYDESTMYEIRNRCGVFILGDGKKFIFEGRY